MKKILSLALACILMLALLTPCTAADKTVSTRSENTVTIGAWPQSLVDRKESAALTAKLKSSAVNWQSDVLPDGRAVLYCDVDFQPFSSPATDRPTYCALEQRPTYRAVRIGGGSVQWYRWEPLTWEQVSYHGLDVEVCTSVVFAVENNDDAVITWLRDSFYQNALSAAEQEEWRVCMPAHGMTNDSVAAVGDYAALYGADGSSYYQVEDPDIPEAAEFERPVCAEDPAAQTEIPAVAGKKDDRAASAVKTEKSTPVCAKQACECPAFIGVRPVLVWKDQPYAGGFISWLLHLLGF